MVSAGTGVGNHAEGSLSPGDLSRITALPGVAATLVLWNDTALATLPRLGRTAVSVQPVAADARLRWQRLTEGSWPRGTDQTLLDAGTAKGADLGVGSSSRVAALDDQGRPLPARALIVAGIVDSGGNLASLGAGPTLFVPDRSGCSDGAGFGDRAGAQRVDLVATAGNAVALRSAVATALVRDRIPATARTADENRTAVVASFATLTRVLSGFVLAFALLALGVAGLVITNTFAILLTQRTRELALLRCVGASTGQVFRAVVAEAALPGAAAGTSESLPATAPLRPRWRSPPARASRSPCRRCRSTSSRSCCRCSRPSS